MRALFALLAACLVAAAVVIGLSQASPDTSASRPPAPGFDLAVARERLAGSPPALASLHEQANQLLPGDAVAFRRRLRSLEGHPVIVNKWASWCGPCRAEAPILQSQGVEQGRRIAFIGLDWRDSASGARDFLSRWGLPFPSYEDRDGKLASALQMPANVPVTLFLDERGKLAYMHQGGYTDERDLAADIDRYLPAA